jgi:hypothetical protein
MHLQTTDWSPEETPFYTDRGEGRVVKHGQGAKVETISFEDW